MTTPNTFYASVSPRTLDKVTRLFNASLTDIFNELLQNARRAGATRIDVTAVHHDGFGPAIVVRDDGCGVRLPQTLFALGDSGWDGATTRREDPAGMGVFSLSPRGAVIRSRHCDADVGWMVQVAPDHFTGKTPIAVDTLAIDPGTEIVFPYTQRTEDPESTLKAAARFCPAPVFFEGVRVEQKNFLDGALHEETWNGIRIGVFPRTFWSTEPTINFHGVTVAARLPSVAFAQGRDCYSARLDVVDCSDLQLVLPARKEVVQGAFFETVKLAVKQSIYRAIGTLDGHRLTVKAWREACEFGIELPEAVAELHPYLPTLTDTNNERLEKPVPVEKGGLLVAFDGDPPEHQSFARAASLRALPSTLLEPCPAYEGYVWYDSLPRITALRHFVTADGERMEVSGLKPPAESLRPDSIRIELTIRHTDGTEKTLFLDTDLLLTGDCWSTCVEDVAPLVTSDSKLSPGDFADLIEAAFFSPSDDAESDSYETQQEWFRDQAERLATSILLSEREADLVAIHTAIRRYVLWLLPSNGETVITVKDRGITVDQQPVYPLIPEQDQ